MQLRKKRKKEREALGDKVSVFPASCSKCVHQTTIDFPRIMKFILTASQSHKCWVFINGLMLSSVQAPPKEVPKTIENQRVYDETTVDPEDEEV